eukprot:1269241-Karenia_brevis.AAC.1
MSDMFTLPSIGSGHVGITSVNGVAVGSSTTLVPCLAVLPMGFGWALHLCQLIVNNIMCQVVGQNRMVEDKRPGICLHHEDDMLGAAY